MSHGIRPTGFKVEIRAEKCIACGKCVDVCARKNFDASPEGKVEPRDPRNCNGCTKCRGACPTKAIVVVPEPLKRLEGQGAMSGTARVARSLVSRDVETTIQGD